MGIRRAAARALRTAFTQPEERPSRNYMGYKPNEADGGVWARCSVHGDLERVRTSDAKFQVEKRHWETEHAGG